MKATIKRLLLSLGYELRMPRFGLRNPDHPDIVSAKTVVDAELYCLWESELPLFSPWKGEPGFQRYHAGVARHTMVSADRCYQLMAFASHALNVAGDFAECGVYKGGTALMLARVLETSTKTLHLFDSFEGLPEALPSQDPYYKQGDFSDTSEAAVTNLLGEHASRAEVHVGWIPQTFSNLEDRKYAFVHVDVDLFQSALDCCHYFYPRLSKGGVMLFDDYGFPSCRGEKDAVDLFCADVPDKVITLPTGQGLIIRS